MNATRLAQLQAALLGLAGSSYSGTVFRILTPLYANKRDALSGEGSRHASGRFHIKGLFLIVYTGCTLKQADWEFSHTARNAGLAREDNLPSTTISADVHFSRVLDLTDHIIRRQLGVTKEEVSRADWGTSTGETLPQAIGRLAHLYRFEAIITPSQGPNNNLNILPENIQMGSFVQIINEDHLPPAS